MWKTAVSMINLTLKKLIALHKRPLTIEADGTINQSLKSVVVVVSRTIAFSLSYTKAEAIPLSIQQGRKNVSMLSMTCPIHLSGKHLSKL